MLAKSLNWVDLPETIITGNCVCSNTDGGTAFSKRTQRMNTSRKEARILPRVNRPRNQVEEVEGEIATYVEASIALTVKVRSMGFHRGMSLWRVSREASTNLGDLCAPSIIGRYHQLNEGKLLSNQESDSSIVVRDGRADHMAKGWAEWITEHSTQAEDLLAPHFKLVTHPVQTENLRLTCRELLRVQSEEPYAVVPHVGICEGAAR
jgi:hypothetical protein